MTPIIVWSNNTYTKKQGASPVCILPFTQRKRVTLTPWFRLLGYKTIPLAMGYALFRYRFW